MRAVRETLLDCENGEEQTSWTPQSRSSGLTWEAEIILLRVRSSLRSSVPLPRPRRDDARAWNTGGSHHDLSLGSEVRSLLEKRYRPHLGGANDSWWVDETDVKIKKAWMYFYRTIDFQGSTIDSCEFL